MTQQAFERAVTGALVTFAVSVGCLGLLGMLLAVLRLAADTATAVAAAAPAGVGVSLAIRRKGK
ncbi:hypothetical protein AB0K92_33190 [Streptomyces sp. NPDC052687]|uniref:hypothetical protein n=1 Tax=Streptomyces sp. NPDC052687 TaxID=3154759 RepID=UPI003420D640